MKNNKIILLINFLIIFFILSFFGSYAKEDNLSKIYQNIRCLICQGQSIEESNSDFAQNLKMVIKDKVDKGFSEQEIYIFLESKYGEWILYKPAFNYKNFFLWAIPYLAFIIGGICLFFMIRKSKIL